MKKKKRKIAASIETAILVEEGGFEPPKRYATDLQSAPFGHSGTPPYSVEPPKTGSPESRKAAFWGEEEGTCGYGAFAFGESGMEQVSSDDGAGGRT